MKADYFAARSLKIVQAKCLETAEAMMCERIPASIDFLLSCDELIQTKEACFTIARRMCSDRVRQWVNSHVNSGVFIKDFYSEIDGTEKPAKDKPTFVLPPGGRNVSHNPDAVSAVKIVETIRMLSLKVVEKKCEESIVDDVTGILESTRKSICERCDFNDSILSVVNKMLVDLLLLILTHCYDVASDDGFLLKFVDHWKSFGGDLFKTVICPRNVRLMAQSKDATKSWHAFTNLLALLLQNGLLSHESLESQCQNDENCRIVLSDLF